MTDTDVRNDDDLKPIRGRKAEYEKWIGTGFDTQLLRHAVASADDVPALLDLVEAQREQNGCFRDERDALIARAREIRDIHREAAYTRPGTCADCGQRYPCPTVQVLDRPLGSFVVSAREAAKETAHHD